MSQWLRKDCSPESSWTESFKDWVDRFLPGLDIVFKLIMARSLIVRRQVIVSSPKKEKEKEKKRKEGAISGIYLPNVIKWMAAVRNLCSLLINTGMPGVSQRLLLEFRKSSSNYLLRGGNFCEVRYRAVLSENNSNIIRYHVWRWVSLVSTSAGNWSLCEASKPRENRNVKGFLKKILHPERHKEEYREDVSGHDENEGRRDANMKGEDAGKTEAEQEYEEEMKEDDKMKFTMGWSSKWKQWPEGFPAMISQGLQWSGAHHAISCPIAQPKERT